MNREERIIKIIKVAIANMHFTDEWCEYLAKEIMALDDAWNYDMSEAPESGYIVVAVKYGDRFSFHHAHTEYDEWIDVHSDRILKGYAWITPPKDKE